MKNTIFFLASMFFFLSNPILKGQSDNVLSINPNSNQANLSSVEMMNLVKMVMEEPGLILHEIIPYLPDEVETVDIELTFEYELVLNNDIDSRYWNEYVINTAVAGDFFASNNYMRAFSKLLNGSLPSYRTIEDPFFEKYESKKFIDDSQSSLMHRANNTFRINLDNNTMMKDIGLMNKVNTSSIGNWNFIVGPGDGFNY